MKTPCGEQSEKFYCPANRASICQRTNNVNLEQTCFMPEFRVVYEQVKGYIMDYLHQVWNSLDSVRKIHSRLEFWAVIFFILLVLADTLAHRYEEKHPPRSRRFAGIGLWVFGIAVLMELVAYPFGQRNDTLAAQANAQQQQNIATLQAEARDAEARIADAEAHATTAEAQVATARAASDAASAKAESFRLDIARANERAADATQTAEADRLARIKMEQQLKARSLTEEQQQRIVASIKPFADTPYELAVNPTPEPLHLADQIDSILHSAEWIPKDNASTDLRLIVRLSLGTKAEETLSTGVSIQLTKALYDKYKQAADILIRALGTAGIPVSEVYLPDSDASPNNIHVVVGSQDLIK